MEKSSRSVIGSCMRLVGGERCVAINGRPIQTKSELSPALWQTFENEIIRMIDHLTDLGIRNAGFYLDRVPVFFIHVIPGPDLLVAIAQFECEVGIAFQIGARWNFIERREGEHFSANFEHERVRTERRALGRVCLAQAIFAKLREIHHEIREIRMLGKSLIAMRSCFIESRSRNVTVSRSAASFSPSDSKSTVTPNGVPTSS